MVIRQKLTPEVFLSLPRRSDAVPAPSGTVAYFTVSTHSFGSDNDKRTRKELMLLDLATGSHRPLLTGAEADKPDTIQALAWLPTRGKNELLWLTTPDPVSGHVDVVVVDVPMSNDALDVATPIPHIVATIPAPVQSVRLHVCPEGGVAFATVGMVGPDGKLFNPKKDQTGKATGRIYNGWKVRRTRERSTVWYGVLKELLEGVWMLGDLHDALACAVSPLEVPVDVTSRPQDVASAYDISPQGVVLTASEENDTDGRSDVYYVAVDAFDQPTLYPPAQIAVMPRSADLMALEAAAAAAATVQNVPGGWQEDETSLPTTGLDTNPAASCSNPRFSPDGTRLAFLRRPFACPADVRLYVGHIVSGAAFDVRLVVNQTPPSDVLAPSSFEFTPSGQAVLVIAPDCGRQRLFVQSLQDLQDRPPASPRALSYALHGSVSSFHVLNSGKADSGGPPSPSFSLLVSGSSFVESSFYHVVDASDDVSGSAFEPRVVSTASKDGIRHGLDHDLQVSEIYVEGGGEGYCVHAWLVRPSEFDPSDRYPVVVLLHDDPEAAWSDQWSWQSWNAAVWAEQGYVVVLPNLSGSLGFGLAHAVRLYGSWGGYPYQDLEKCIQAVKGIPFVDRNRAVLAGSRYGGYLVNWTLGNGLAKEFKAAISHNSVFNTAQLALTTDLPINTAYFHGPPFPWNNYDAVNRWNPSRPDLLQRWKDNAPPTLVIHTGQDDRCPLTESLATFRSLQFQGVSSRLLTFPDEDHTVSNPDNALLWHHTVFDWINSWARDQGQAPTPSTRLN